MLVKAEVTQAPKDGPVKKAVPSQFPLLERVKGKSSEQLKALEENFQRSGTLTDAELGNTFHTFTRKLGTVHPKPKIHISPLTCSAVCQSKLFWCELPTFGDIGHGDFCLLSNIMGLNGALLVVLTDQNKIHLKNYF